MGEDSVRIGPVDGTVVAFTQDGGEVFWTCNADPRLEMSYKVFHTGGGLAAQIAASSRPGTVQVDFGVDGIDGHLLWWEFQCRARSSLGGRWPVHVQFFQGTARDGYRAISRVIRYEVPVGGLGWSSVADHVAFRAAGSEPPAADPSLDLDREGWTTF